MPARRIERILLLDPPVTRPRDFSHARCRVSVFTPLGLAYIAAVVENAGYKVRIVDGLLAGIDSGERPYGDGMLRYGLEDDQIAAILRSERPDVVGISCLFSNKDLDMRLAARLVKQVLPEATVVVGGVHPTALGTKLLEEEAAIDYIVLGEGEKTFLDLIRVLEGKGDVSSLDGIVYREGGLPVLVPKTSFLADLNSLPLPARHLLDMRAYLGRASAHSGYKQKPFASVVSSRGCPAKCTFCAIELLWGKTPRFRSSASVLDEIEFLVRQYGVREIHFEDDNLTSDKQRALEIFDGLVRRKLGLSWTVPSGLAIYSLDEELLEAMAASGCYSISLAVESGDQEVLNTLMRKPSRLERVKPLVDKARSLGMKTKGFFILGFPGETKRSMQRTVEFAKSLDLDWALFFPATPLIGTKLYETCKAKHYLKDELVDFSRSFYVGNIETDQFDCDYVEKVKDEANIDVNFRCNANLRKYDADEAIRDFKSVLDFYPHLWFAHLYLGDAYERKGDMSSAAREWNEALRLNPSLDEARQRIDRPHEGVLRPAGPRSLQRVQGKP